MSTNISETVRDSDIVTVDNKIMSKYCRLVPLLITLKLILNLFLNLSWPNFRNILHILPIKPFLNGYQTLSVLSHPVITFVILQGRSRSRSS